MTFQYVDLPYPIHALEPHISAKTMTFHHDKHYKKYVDSLNDLLSNSKLADMTLIEVMMRSHLKNNTIFQNAAQVWNHEFYWKCLSANAVRPSQKVQKVIDEHFGSLKVLKDEFKEAAITHFGSGWVWIVRGANGGVEIQALANAENPFTNRGTPLLVCDVWEHAYYLDYKDNKGEYIDHFWQIIDWEFFEKNIFAIERHEDHPDNQDIHVGF